MSPHIGFLLAAAMAVFLTGSTYGLVPMLIVGSVLVAMSECVRAIMIALNLLNIKTITIKSD